MSLTALIEKNVDTIFTSIGDLSTSVIFEKVNLEGFDPITSTVVKNEDSLTVEAIITEYKSAEINESAGILPQDKKVIVKGKTFTFTPSIKDVILINNKKHIIVNWKTVPGNSIYIFQVRATA